MAPEQPQKDAPVGVPVPLADPPGALAPFS